MMVQQDDMIETGECNGVDVDLAELDESEQMAYAIRKSMSTINASPGDIQSTGNPSNRTHRSY